MDEKLKVSVVVPVYNVELYLEKCINSILKQTYSDFEILLIDDGSTDHSGELCDRFAVLDKRIRVIHQKNEGLAEVRNIGIKNAKGSYILFVDSDDWIDQITIEKCLSIIEKYNADIVCFRFIKEYCDKTHKENKSYAGDDIKILNKKEALELLFYPKYVDTITCNKFVKREMFEGVIYPKGKLHEDLFTTYKFVANAETIVCISDELYHYYQNPQSIGHLYFSENTYDIAVAVDECRRFIIDVIGEDTKKLAVGAWFRKIFIVNSMINSDYYDYSYIKKLRDEMKLGDIIFSEELGKTRKIQMEILCLNFGTYKFVYKLLKRLRLGKGLIVND